MEINKHSIRKNINSKRKALDKTVVQSKSTQITQNFFKQFSLEQVKNISIYLPKHSSNEVDTRPILEKIWKDFPPIKTFIPVIEGEITITSVQISNLKGLKQNKFGIEEPFRTITSVPAEELDMVIVPLVAFDKKRSRIGYGKGCYDRFLVGCDLKCLKVGLAFELQRVESILSEKHDIKLGNIVTEEGVY